MDFQKEMRGFYMHSVVGLINGKNATKDVNWLISGPSIYLHGSLENFRTTAYGLPRTSVRHMGVLAKSFLMSAIYHIANRTKGKVVAYIGKVIPGLHFTLPERVTACFTDLIGKFLELKRQSGGSWHVELIRSGDKLLLQSGWSNFASANNILQNDFLLFKFIGESRFEVQIFDQMGWVKRNDPLQFVRRTKTSSLELNNYDVEGPHEVKVHTAKLSRASRSITTEEERYNGTVKTGVTKTPRIMKKCLPPGDKSFYMPRLVMGAEQKKRFYQLASEVQIGNPSFVKVLGKCSLSVSGIKLSRKFCDEHLPKETEDVILCLLNNEKIWSVKYYYRRGHQTFECTPWAKFVQETKLQEGDMCLFELVKAAKQITFIVHVSRATKTSSLELGNYDVEGPHEVEVHTTKLLRASRSITTEEERYNGTDKTGLTKAPPIMRKCLAPGDKSFFMPRLVMGEEQEKRFHQLASEVQIGNPSFVKVLRKCSLSVTGIELSCKFCTEHLPKETQDVILCLPNNEKIWFVKYYYRRGHQNFKCTPWAKFVQETKLQEGDMCLFELVKAAKQITFIVHVSRAT